MVSKDYNLPVHLSVQFVSISSNTSSSSIAAEQYY